MENLHLTFHEFTARKRGYTIALAKAKKQNFQYNSESQISYLQNEKLNRKKDFLPYYRNAQSKKNILRVRIYLYLFIVTGSRATANNGFKSYPTTVKTFENDTVLLPCYVEDLGK